MGPCRSLQLNRWDLGASTQILGPRPTVHGQLPLLDLEKYRYLTYQGGEKKLRENMKD